MRKNGRGFILFWQVGSVPPPHPRRPWRARLCALNCWEPAPGAPRWPAPCTCAQLGWRHRRARKRQDSWEKPALHRGRQHLKLWPLRASGPPPAAPFCVPGRIPQLRPWGWQRAWQTGVSGGAAVPLLQKAGGTSCRTPDSSGPVGVGERQTQALEG